MAIQSAIKEKITAALSPASLEVIDDSASHAGHAGANPAGESHFKVIVVSDQFEGKNRVDRQRMVYAILKDEMSAHIHALEIKALTPEEVGA